MKALYPAPASVFTFRLSESPRLMLVVFAKPSIPPFPTGGLLPSFQPTVPGKQFSTVTAFPVEHDRATGVTWTADELADSTPDATARTT
jgi:hypothetical protein